MNTLTIEELKNTVTLISDIQCDFLSENCIVALEDHSHSSGCALTVTGDKSERFSLNWAKKVNKAGYKEPIKYTEHGAEAIAFMLSTQFTPYKVLEEALIGTGIDYWLGYADTHPDYDPLNFLRARLEVSGIRNETVANNLKKRVKEKKEQTKPSDRQKLPAYIAVVEFSSPKAFFGKK